MKKLFNITLCCGLALALSGCWKKKHMDAAAPVAEIGMDGKKDVAEMDAKKFEVAELDSSAKSGEEKEIEGKLDDAKKEEELTDENPDSANETEETKPEMRGNNISSDMLSRTKDSESFGPKKIVNSAEEKTAEEKSFKGRMGSLMNNNEEML